MSRVNKIYLTSVGCFIIAGIIGVGVVINRNINLGAELELTEVQKIDVEIDKIDLLQASELDKTKKYKYIPEYEKDGYQYETHEYKMPDGSVGYCKYINKTDGKDIYSKTICNGKLAESRNHDWILREDMFINKDGKMQIDINK